MKDSDRPSRSHPPRPDGPSQTAGAPGEMKRERERVMLQLVYSNAAPQDDFVNPPVPAQPEQGNLGTLMQAIDRGAPIRVGMLRSGTIRNSVFTVENVRYWKTEDDSQYVAIASLI